MNACLAFKVDGSILASLQVKPVPLEQAKEAQKLVEKLVKLIKEVQNGEKLDFKLREDGVLLYQNRLCVPKNDKLRKEILSEAHTSPYAMHLGGTTMSSIKSQQVCYNPCRYQSGNGKE
nr:uncharacterized protein LOC117275035 [Nicotiana tomentosiformis]